MKLLVIGFDGLDYTAFTREGYHVEPLLSEVPITGPAWASIYTGKHPSKYKDIGLWGEHLFLKNPFWNMLECSKALFFLPLTFPVQQTAFTQYTGFSGYVPKSSFLQYCGLKEPPSRYYEAIDLIYAGYTLREKPFKLHDRYWAWHEAIENMEDKLGFVQKSNDLLNSLLQNSTEFAFIQYSFIDRLLHLKFDTGIFEEMQRLIAYCEGYFHADNVMIVSDHGFQNYEHSDHGILAVKGKDLVLGKGEKKVQDIAPTILNFFDIEVEMDGRNVLL